MLGSVPSSVDAGNDGPVTPAGLIPLHLPKTTDAHRPDGDLRAFDQDRRFGLCHIRTTSCQHELLHWVFGAMLLDDVGAAVLGMI